MTSDLPTSCY
jgi:hypothetical protein